MAFNDTTENELRKRINKNELKHVDNWGIDGLKELKPATSEK